MWRFSTPVIVNTEEEDGTPTPGPPQKPQDDATQTRFEYYPIQGGYGEDKRFRRYGHPLPKGWPKLPDDFIGVGLVANDENEQVNLYHHTDPRMVAANRFGDSAMGSLVCEMGERFKVDIDREAPLQSAFRVIHKAGRFRHIDFGIENWQPSDNIIGLQFNTSGLGDTTGGVTVDIPFANTSPFAGGGPGARTLSVQSNHYSGPFHPGSYDDKHSYGEDEDGNRLIPGHFSTLAFFRWRGDGKSKQKQGGLPGAKTPSKQAAGGGAGPNIGPFPGVEREDFLDAPLQFENVIYNDGGDSFPTSLPSHFPHITRCHIWEDPQMLHPFWGATKAGQPPHMVDGMWRIYAETPWRKVPSCKDRLEGVGDNRPSVPSKDKRFAVGRDRGDNDRQMVGTNLDVGMSSIVMRPQKIGVDTEDLRQAWLPSVAETLHYDDTAPTVGVIQGFAAQGGASGITGGGTEGDNYDESVAAGEGCLDWTYTDLPCSDKWLGGTADGGNVILPPELDLADFATDRLGWSVTNGGLTRNFAWQSTAENHSKVQVVYGPNAWCSWGIPNVATGGIIYGWESGIEDITKVSVDQTGSETQLGPNLNWYTVDPWGNRSLEFSISPANGIDFYSGQGTVGRMKHANTAFRTWTFPDTTGTILVATADSYTVSNETVNRTIDADNITLHQLADVVSMILLDTGLAT
jgi:hypothetical protein